MFLVACSGNETQELQEVNLEIEPLLHIEPLYFSPLYMSYDKENRELLVNSGSMSEYPVQKINVENGEINNLMRKGRGRDEYIQLRISDVDRKGNIYGRSYPFELAFSSSGELLSKYDTSKSELNIFSSNRFKGMNIVYGNFKHPKSLLTLLDDSWQEICHFGEFPDDGTSEAEVGEFGKIMAYQGVILSSESRSRVAFISYYHGEFLNIFSVGKKNNIELVYRKQENLPKYRDNGSEGTGVIFSSRDVQYVSMCCSDDRIYILYSGKEITEASNIAFQEAQLTNQIMVFDWDGNHLYNLFSDSDMISICVSDDDKELYVVYFDQEAEYRLGRLDISEI